MTRGVRTPEWKLKRIRELRPTSTQQELSELLGVSIDVVKRASDGIRGPASRPTEWWEVHDYEPYIHNAVPDERRLGRREEPAV